MKFINMIVMLLLMLTFASCSSGSSDDSEEEYEEVVSDVDADESEFFIDEEDEEFADDGEFVEEEIALNDVQEEDTLDLSSPSNLNESAPQMVSSGSNGQYTVKNGDTLMWIAFQVYGDYGRWKDIARQNSLGAGSKLQAGQTISYEAPATPFTWNPQGMPYVISRGDTLGKISNNKYGTPKYWKALFENNRPLFKSPNLIFAGFTMYYLPKRDIASKY